MLGGWDAAGVRPARPIELRPEFSAEKQRQDGAGSAIEY